MHKLYVSSLLVLTIIISIGFAVANPEPVSAQVPREASYVCGDSNFPDDVANWGQHNTSQANNICVGCNEGGFCTGWSYEVWECTSPSQIWGNECFGRRIMGGINLFGGIQTINFGSIPVNDCNYYQINVYDNRTHIGDGRDFVHFRGSRFGTCGTGGSTPVPTSPPPPSSTPIPTAPPTGGGGGGATPPYTPVGGGTNVYVCGDSTPGNGSANWAEHNANPMCQGCVQGSHCSGARVDIYRCTSPSQLGPRVDAYECRQNRIYSGPATANFSQWFTDQNAVIQIDVYNSSNSLTDFVIWKGSNFGNATPAPTPVPTQPPLSCSRICTDPNNCPFYNPATQQTFPDVPASNPYFAHIQNLECENVVHGFSDGYFKPTNPITRAEMSKMIQNGYRYPENTNCMQFRDVPTSSKFYIEIMTLRCNGVITGYPDNTFRPDNLITRGEASKFIVNGARVAMGDRYFLNNTNMSQVYSDVPTNHTYFGFINSMYSNGVTDPNIQAGTYQPDRNMLRQEMALYVDKVMAKMYAAGWGR